MASSNRMTAARMCSCTSRLSSALALVRCVKARRSPTRSWPIAVPASRRPTTSAPPTDCFSARTALGRSSVQSFRKALPDIEMVTKGPRLWCGPFLFRLRATRHLSAPRKPSRRLDDVLERTPARPARIRRPPSPRGCAGTGAAGGVETRRWEGKAPAATPAAAGTSNICLVLGGVLCSAAGGLVVERAGLAECRCEVFVLIAERHAALADRHAAIGLSLDAAIDRDQPIGRPFDLDRAVDQHLAAAVHGDEIGRAIALAGDDHD